MSEHTVKYTYNTQPSNIGRQNGRWQQGSSVKPFDWLFKGIVKGIRQKGGLYMSDNTVKFDGQTVNGNKYSQYSDLTVWLFGFYSVY